MKAIRKFEAIQWKAGQQRTIEERTVDDEYTYLFIDFLPPRKFTTYPIDLEDFTIGYCLGEGLIKDYSDIESIKVEGTNVLVSTNSHMFQKRTWNRKELFKIGRATASMLVSADCLNIMASYQTMLEESDQSSRQSRKTHQI